LAIWGKVAINGEFLAPIGVQGIEEKRISPIWGEVRGHLEGVFDHYLNLYIRGTVYPTPRIASDFTPYDWGTLFVNTLHSNRVPMNSPFGVTLPKMTKNHLKLGGTPFLARFFNVFIYTYIYIYIYIL